MAVFRDGNRPKDRLPLEHMSLDDDLRFFLEIFYNMEIVDYDCEGFYAGVMLDNNRKLKLGVNIDILDQFPIPEELYILTHEGGHIVFDHLIRGERWVNKQAANIAADAVLNSILNRHYPQIHMPKKDGKTIGITLEGLYKDGMIKDEDLQLLKKDLKELTTDDVYEIVMKNAPKQPQQGQGQSCNCPNCGKDMKKPPQKGQQSKQAGQQGQQGQPQPGDGQPGEGQPGEGQGEGEGDKPGEGEGKDPKPGQGPGGVPTPTQQKVTPIMGPGTPSGMGTKKSHGNATVKCPHCGAEHDAQITQGSGDPGQDTLDAYDKQRIDNHEGVTGDDVDDETRQQIEELVRQAKAGMYGDKAGNFVRDLMEAVKKHFPFKEILDKIIYKAKYDFAREHRRIQIPNGYLPRRRSEKIKVYAMVDVSGSCYDYTEDFVGYIMALDEFEEIILIDTQIQMIVSKGDGIPKVVPGGGGTDLNPGFQRWREVEQTTKGYKLNFICLTDGEIPELTTGPVQSKVVVLTTNAEVYYNNSPRRYMNIKINPDEDK